MANKFANLHTIPHTENMKQVTASAGVIKIGLAELAELRDHAARCPYDTSKLSYLDVQTVIHLYGLEQLLLSFGIQSPFDLIIPLPELPAEVSDYASTDLKFARNGDY